MAEARVFRNGFRRGGRWLAVTALVSALSGVWCGGAQAQDGEEILGLLGENLATIMAFQGQNTGYDVVFRRNPMEPLVDKGGQLLSVAGLSGGLSVQGIIWAESQPMVVMDEGLLKEGDTIGPYTIREIRRDGLIARRDGQKIFIPLDRGVGAAPKLAQTVPSEVNESAEALAESDVVNPSP